MSCCNMNRSTGTLWYKIHFPCFNMSFRNAKMIVVMLLCVLMYSWSSTSNVVAQTMHTKDMKSTISQMAGHYPSSLCRITFAGLNASGEEFTYIGSPDLVSEKCSGSTLSVWPIRGIPDITADQINMDPKYRCHETYDVGVVFTVFYWVKTSNYFHLHYDMTLPLFKFFDEYTKNIPTSSVVLMPSIETTRLKRINWDTDAFDDESKYWNQLVKLVAGERPIKPLNRALLDQKRNLCFKTIYFGTIKHRGYNPERSYIRKYVNAVRKQLKIKPVRTFTSHRIGIITRILLQLVPLSHIHLIVFHQYRYHHHYHHYHHPDRRYHHPCHHYHHSNHHKCHYTHIQWTRKNRRKILNEEELVDTVKSLAPVDLLAFETMTLSEQIHAMQKYTVLVGVNGAGLMNGLYLPPHAVAVQLVPYNSSVNWKEFGATLEGRGPYLVYHNTHPDRSVVKPHDKYINNPDTSFDPGEFKELVKNAMDLAEKTARGQKDES